MTCIIVALSDSFSHLISKFLRYCDPEYHSRKTLSITKIYPHKYMFEVSHNTSEFRLYSAYLILKFSRIFFFFSANHDKLLLKAVIYHKRPGHTSDLLSQHNQRYSKWRHHPEVTLVITVTQVGAWRIGLHLFGKNITDQKVFVISSTHNKFHIFKHFLSAE